MSSFFCLLFVVCCLLFFSALSISRLSLYSLSRCSLIILLAMALCTSSEYLTMASVACILLVTAQAAWFSWPPNDANAINADAIITILFIMSLPCSFACVDYTA